MNRTRHHAHVAFRMLGHDKRPPAPALERRSNADKQALPNGQRAANDMNKLLQQFTLYFCEDPQSNKWITRTDDDIKLTTYIYRMAANLVLWGEVNSPYPEYHLCHCQFWQGFDGWVGGGAGTQFQTPHDRSALRISIRAPTPDHSDDL